MLFQSLYTLSVLAILFPASAWHECFNATMSSKLQNIELKVVTDDTDIHLKWSNNQTEEIFGFKVNILDSSKKIIYESPILHPQTKRMNIKTDLPIGKNYACVQILCNLTSSTGQVCRDLKVSDLKMVMGILAGVVFLIPCFVIFIVFIYKDKQIQKTDMEYQKLLHVNRNDSFVYDETTTTTMKSEKHVSMLPERNVFQQKIKSGVITETIFEEPEAKTCKTQAMIDNGAIKIQGDYPSTSSPTVQKMDVESKGSKEQSVFVIHV